MIYRWWWYIDNKRWLLCQLHIVMLSAEATVIATNHPCVWRSERAIRQRRPPKRACMETDDPAGIHSDVNDAITQVQSVFDKYQLNLTSITRQVLRRALARCVRDRCDCVQTRFESRWRSTFNYWLKSIWRSAYLGQERNLAPRAGEVVYHTEYSRREYGEVIVHASHRPSRSV